MPLGEIKPRELTLEETRWHESWKKFDGKDINVLIPELYRMSRKEYFAFMYYLDPRLALVMSQEPNFKEILEYQRDKSLWQEFKDYVRRKINDRQIAH